MGPILVFGHRNPDNDSICSAVAYAHLKNLSDPENVYVPVRLGPVPPETRWVFERFGLALPEEIADVRPRVRDVMTAEPITAPEDTTMLQTGRLMRERGVRMLPVVDSDRRVVGVVAERNLAERYLSETELVGFGDLPVSVRRLVDTLDGRLLAGDDATLARGSVRIATDEPQTVRAEILPGDIVIVGDRVRTQPLVVEAGATCLIVAGGGVPAPQVVDRARRSGVALILTRHPAYAAARLVGLAHAVRDFMDREPLLLSPDLLLSEATDELLDAPQRSAVVIDEATRPIGVVTRTDLARGGRRRVVLVDHNETAQSAEGIEDASVVEIVDHHRVGDVQTARPILFLNLPVGSTATIVARRFEDLGVEIPEALAGILLSAVLTDTVLLRSPTTTQTDRTIAERLAAKVGLDAVQFGMEVYRARSAGQVFSAERVVGADLKEFRSGELRVGIGQYETVDLAGVLRHEDEVRAAMDAMRAQYGYDLFLLMLTDIVQEGTRIFGVGKVRLAERALDVDLSSGSAWMPGVLSRKQQVAAPIVDAGGA
jgi:manganese-dependent inorganic pyrophosphatase